LTHEQVRRKEDALRQILRDARRGPTCLDRRAGRGMNPLPSGSPPRATTRPTTAA